MMSFIEYIEYIEESSLHSWDIDDTLLHTNANVHVKDKHGNTVKKLTNQEFNDHKLHPDHHYDFSEFSNAEKFNKESKPMPKMIDTLKRVHNKIKLGLSPHSKVVMNTARADFDDKHKFLDTFKKHGIDIDKIHVNRAGNEPGNDQPAQKKLIYLRKHLAQHPYKNVHVYDDSYTNLKAVKGMAAEYPNTKFHTWHVGPNGSMRKV